MHIASKIAVGIGVAAGLAAVGIAVSRWEDNPITRDHSQYPLHDAAYSVFGRHELGRDYGNGVRLDNSTTRGFELISQGLRDADVNGDRFASWSELHALAESFNTDKTPTLSATEYATFRNTYVELPRASRG